MVKAEFYVMAICINLSLQQNIYFLLIILIKNAVKVFGMSNGLIIDLRIIFISYVCFDTLNPADVDIRIKTH